MGTPIDKFAPTTIHSLDVAFNSDTIPLHEDQPIAMAYGFTYGAADSLTGVTAGQKKDTLKLNQQVYFKIFDTAQHPVDRLTGLLIIFEDNKSPFSWSRAGFSSDQVPAVSIGAGAGLSHGCNVRGREWICGPYQAVNPGDFECIVNVWVPMANGGNKVFDVDPEIIVEGAN